MAEGTVNASAVNSNTQEKIDAIYKVVVEESDNIVNLFDHGVISEVTGGFTGYMSNTDGRCETTIDETLYIKGGVSAGACIDTNNIIDVTEYDALVIEIVGYTEDAEGSGYRGLLGLMNTHATPTAPSGGSSPDNSHITQYACRTFFDIGSKSCVLNLLNVTGEYYPRISLHQSNAGGNQYLSVSKMYLVKFK